MCVSAWVMGRAEFIRPSRANEVAPIGARNHKAPVIFMVQGDPRHARLTERPTPRSELRWREYERHQLFGDLPGRPLNLLLEAFAVLDDPVLEL